MYISLRTNACDCDSVHFSPNGSVWSGETDLIAINFCRSPNSEASPQDPHGGAFPSKLPQHLMRYCDVYLLQRAVLHHEVAYFTSRGDLA